MKAKELIGLVAQGDVVTRGGVVYVVSVVSSDPWLTYKQGHGSLDFFIDSWGHASYEVGLYRLNKAWDFPLLLRSWATPEFHPSRIGWMYEVSPRTKEMTMGQLIEVLGYPVKIIGGIE